MSEHWITDTKNTRISTLAAFDTGRYETGICDERYHEHFIIVEEYECKIGAFKGHKKWERLAERDLLPNPLVEVGTNPIAALCKAVGCTREYYRKDLNKEDT